MEELFQEASYFLGLMVGLLRALGIYEIVRLILMVIFILAAFSFTFKLLGIGKHD